MYKIIVVGAGTAGLSFAYKLCNPEFEIKIYEKKSKEELGYPWYDSVKLEAFTAAGIPLPIGGIAGKKIFNMYSPDCKGSISQRRKTEIGGVETDRVFLVKHLQVLASKNAVIQYETEVTGLVVGANGAVVGVQFVNGETESCDLVVDGCGAFSPLRAFLPMPAEDVLPLPEDVLYCSRAFYKSIDGLYTGKFDSVYLKHMGSKGISWCRTAPVTGDMDIFVSLIGQRLTPEYLQKAEDDIREKNPVVSLELVNRRFEKLGLRYPLSRFVFDGYAAVGDSAYMSMPINGSGIEGAMRSGSILAAVVGESQGRFDTAELWQYQVKLMRTYGSSLLVYDIFRRYLLELEVVDINWAFNTFMSAEIQEIADTDMEHIKNLKFTSIVKKLPEVFERKDMVSSGLKVLRTALAAKTTAMLIPAFFERRLVSGWEKRYNSYIKDKKYMECPG